jgi:hypothetical protein
VDAGAVAEMTGAFVNPDPVYLQSTGFVLDPAGKVAVSVHSSGDGGDADSRDRGGCRARDDDAAVPSYFFAPPRQNELAVTLRSLDAPEEWTLYSVLAEIEALSLDLLEVRNHQDQFTTAHRDAHYRQVRRFRHHRSCLQPRALVPVVTPSFPPVSRIGARPAEIIAHGWTAGLERTGQAARIGSLRACQWAVLIAGGPARADDPASVHQAVRTRRLLRAR